MTSQSAMHRTIFVVDVAGFGHHSRTNRDQMTIRDGLYGALRGTFRDMAIPWNACDHEDRGDGVLVLIPPEVPKCRVVDAFPERLVAALHGYNEGRRDEEQIRLRLALHAGEVHYDDHGVVGAAVNLAFRLLDSSVVKETMAGCTSVLAVVSSVWFFEEVIRHSPAAKPDAYRQVHVTEKETSTPAWIRLSDGGIGSGSMAQPDGVLDVLVVDDEPYALDDLLYLLRADQRIGHVEGVTDATTALRYINNRASRVAEPLGAVFLDIRMPGLNGLDLARALAQFAEPPRVVFVTAFDRHAAEAFNLKAVDYLLKPVRPERLTDTVNRLIQAASPGRSRSVDTMPAPKVRGDETIPVELGGVVRFIQLADVRFVEAQRDYVRLSTAEGGFLVRTPISVLAEDWADAGFVRIHRSHLVAVKHIEELRVDAGQMTVVVGNQALTVSRRYSRQVRDVLVRNVRPGTRPE
jgi:DNA-binding LytR/AlgR family response regulator